MSLLTQHLFDARNGLVRRACTTESLLARAVLLRAGQVLQMLSNQVGRHEVVRGRAYGFELRMPSEHTLIPILAEFPNFNRPLAIAARVLLKPGRVMSVIDVGANIGETVAVIEETSPGKCTYLCIEPDPHLAELCRQNYHQNTRVVIREAAIGERAGQPVILQNDGRANPSVKETSQPGAMAIAKLDAVAEEFATVHGLDLIKTDTEGYDFAVLRSAEGLLRSYRPAVFFEWFPKLLLQAGEDPNSIFSFLGDLGYRHWILFTNRGDLYCEISEPSNRLVEVLERTALASTVMPYYDVFACADEELCHRLTDSFLGTSIRGAK